MKALQNKLRNKKQKGFTLIELIVVIIIIGILAAIAVPRMMSVRETAQDGADTATARTIVSAVSVASTKVNGDLSRLSEFVADVDKAVDVKVVAGKTPADGEWGVEYDDATKSVKVYHKPNGKNAVEEIKVKKEVETASSTN